ncbi:MAG: ATP-binding protein [Myxococcota bacterium]
MSEKSAESQGLASAGALLGVVAHSFNNILQGITTSLDLAATSTNPTQCAQFLDQAAVLVAEGALLAHRILSWISQSRAQFDICELGDLVRAIAVQFDASRPTNVKLTTAIEADSALVRGSSRELNLLVSSLLANALEALSDGGGGIRISVRPVPVGLATGGAPAQMFELSVQDDGPGMTEEVRAHCLEPFFTTHVERGASGLGLPIAQGIARRHAGRLVIDSAQGVGTRVSVLLPRLEPAPQQ